MLLKFVSNKTLPLSLSLAFIFWGCSKDDAVEQISIADTNAASVIEGAYLLYDLELNVPSKKDFSMKAAFSTDAYKSDYANPEDYTASVQYSYDGGTTWLPEKNSVNNTSVEFPEGTKTLKVRIATTDDNLLEIAEEKFDVTLSPPTSDPYLQVLSTIKLKAVVQDNDVIAEIRKNFEGQQDDLLSFQLNPSTGRYLLIGVRPSVSNEEQKKIVDGEYKTSLDMMTSMMVPGMQKPTLIEVFYSSSGLGGSIGFMPNHLVESSDAFAEMVLIINIRNGYYKDGGAGSKQDFNADGRFLTTLVHEFGHAMTLCNSQRSSVKEKSECTSGLYIALENRTDISCFKSDSYAAHFLTEFYDVNAAGTAMTSKTNLSGKAFISDYARQGGYSEDMAEHFAQYVYLENNVPVKGQNQEAYLNKTAFFKNYPALETFKSNLLQVIKSKNFKLSPVD